MSLTAEQKARVEEALVKIRSECANAEYCKTCPLYKKQGKEEHQYCCFWVDKASNLDCRDISLIIGFIDGVLNAANVKPTNDLSPLPPVAKAQSRRLPWREYIDNFGNVTLVNRETGEILRENLNEAKKDA